ncbi:hypothetical protein HanPSC8_Chr05g0187691 [Helianthus annuus]|nr:hypothetical protein HanPSC8_Chr05g0187691 [Helianthus annuus]
MHIMWMRLVTVRLRYEVKTEARFPPSCLGTNSTLCGIRTS